MLRHEAEAAAVVFAPDRVARAFTAGELSWEQAWEATAAGIEANLTLPTNPEGDHEMTATTHTMLAEHNMSTALVDDLEVPVLTGPQAQGDLIVAPTWPGRSARETVSVPAEGIVLVRGNGGHEHRLVGTGSWTPGPAGDADLGVLTVPEDGTAHLIHEEHGMLSIGPGCYRIGRQTEQWDQIRVVAD